MNRTDALEHARKMSRDTGEEWGVYVAGKGFSAGPVSRCAPGTSFVARYNAGNLASGAAYAGKVPSPGILVPRA